MLHDDEVANEDYVGCLEAQLLGAKLLAIFQNREAIQRLTLGRDVEEEEE